MSNFLSSISNLVSQATNVGPSHKSKNDGLAPDMATISMTDFRLGVRKCISGQEVNKFIENHIKYLKWQITTGELAESDMATLLLQCVVCKSFGHDVKFADIHAIQLAQSAQLWRNKVSAYNACQLMLGGSSDMIILMISTLQRDILNSNPAVIQLGLEFASGSLITPELLPPLEKAVIERTKHPLPSVRKKAVACLGTFMTKQQNMDDSYMVVLKKALCDKDPTVMSVAIQVLYDLEPFTETEGRGRFVDLLLSIQNQVINKRLPAAFTRGFVAGPWVLIKLVKLITKLDLNIESQSQRVLINLLKIMDLYDKVNTDIAIAVVTECCLVLPAVTANPMHLERAAKYSGQLLKSNVPKLKAIALKIIGALAKLNPQYAIPYQHLIVSELKSTDSVMVDSSMKIIIQLTTPTNIKQVYELFKECAYCSSNKAKFQDQGLDILTCCDLKEVDQHWFATAIAEITSMHILKVSALDKILNYLSHATITTAIYDEFKANVEKASPEACCDLLIIFIWMVNQLDDTVTEMGSFLLSMCGKMNKCDNALYLLLGLRQLMLTSCCILEKNHIRQLREIATQLGFYTLANPYLTDMDSMNQKVPVNCNNIDLVYDSLCHNIKVYKNLRAGNNDHKLAECIQQSDSLKITFPFAMAKRTDVHTQIDLKNTRKVWTAQGHVGKSQRQPNHTEGVSSDSRNDRISQLVGDVFSSAPDHLS